MNHETLTDQALASLARAEKRIEQLRKQNGELRTALAAAEDRIARLRAALGPLAGLAPYYRGLPNDHRPLSVASGDDFYRSLGVLTVGDVRAARAAWEEGGR